ncbi:class I SAM-dependent methyltransferase [Herbaspirillum sp. DW155]|uniref:class I SAM-dependent methyltransferase n=1 Tax=Herbaspirillum sp. DW155 TaxID=3095609 RepID=UPI00308C01EB|nr:class I SAM-dependent methyltransferase [Herbaspirillum sp. DW155]
MKCTVCGGEHFEARTILWDELTNDWQLSEYEAGYINRQQGEACTQCGANLRSIALADAIRHHIGTTDTLLAFASSKDAEKFSILEINEAGNLTQALRRFPHHVFGEYLQVDIHAIPYPDASFDLVVHSDTLEHVPNPVHALQECRRVLNPGGALCFTVPVIVDRMTRNRTGMKKKLSRRLQHRHR